MNISHWMTTAVVTVKPHDTLRHARALMATPRINQPPVTVDGKLVGIVTDRDIRDAYPSSLRLLRGQGIDDFADSYTVEEVMTYNVSAVSPQTPLREAAQCLREQRFGALPVVEHDKLVGILTRSDLLDALLAGAADTAHTG
jgi:acetoin utilization protein AcuB